MTILFDAMVNATSYPMPSYIGYIVNAYKAYQQFTNPVSDIFREPYASGLSTLYNGTLGLDDINIQLTTSVPDLFTSDFISGFATNPKYTMIRSALVNNSVSAWKTDIPLLLIHGGNDTQVNPLTTENMYSAMVQAGTSTDLIKKVIVPGVDHSDGAVPCILQSIFFLQELNNSR